MRLKVSIKYKTGFYQVPPQSPKKAPLGFHLSVHDVILMWGFHLTLGSSSWGGLLPEEPLLVVRVCVCRLH